MTSPTDPLEAAHRREVSRRKQMDPHLVAFDDGKFALHIQYGGGAVIVDVGQGSEDQDAFREWVERATAALATPRPTGVDVERFVEEVVAYYRPLP